MLNRVDYVVMDSAGGIGHIFCKVCGEKIAGTQVVPVDNGKYAYRFRRFPRYTEIKMVFDDGHFHITNGCSRCLSMNMDPELLQEMHDADMKIMPTVTAAEGVKAVRVVAIDNSVSGII